MNIRNTTLHKLMTARTMHEMQSLSLKCALQLWSKESPSLKELQKTISDELENRSKLLDIGIDKCLQGQASTQLYNRTKSIYQLNGATLHGNELGSIPILLIPSHINRGYIMDLIPEHSLLQALQRDDICPYLLEWNQSQPAQLNYDDSDYMSEILIPMLEYIYNKHQRPVFVLGHCMGGLFATAAAQLSPKMIAGLITLATPWDFHVDVFPYRLTEATYNMITPKLEGYVPKEIINTMVQWPQINTTIEKLISLAEKPEASTLFIAVENWLDDGMDMTIPLFDTCIRKFSLLNQPYKGQWQVMATTIDPRNITAPALSIIASEDKVVPPSSSISLSKLLANGEVHEVNSGHLGMLISKNHSVAPKISQWILSLEL